MSNELRSVLVVDDSALIRRLIADLLTESGEFRVAGMAVDGMDAIRKIHALEPSLVTLDIGMPELDGIQVLGYVMSETPRPIVMLSGIGARDAEDMTIRALELGAVDFVRKPVGESGLNDGTLGPRLLSALRTAANVNLAAAGVLARPTVATRRAVHSTTVAAHVIAIASSTGGPRALAEILPALPPDLDAAVLVVQHMPSRFTASLARRLDSLGSLPVSEARDGETICANHVYVAPGGLHMAVDHSTGGPRIALHDQAAVWGMRPAADVLFKSVAAAFPGRSVGLVLTGMGRDGADGLRSIRSSGGYGVVQDRSSSAVYGMPLAALTAAGADCIATLAEIPSALIRGLRTLREPADVAGSYSAWSTLQ